MSQRVILGGAGDLGLGRLWKLISTLSLHGAGEILEIPFKPRDAFLSTNGSVFCYVVRVFFLSHKFFWGRHSGGVVCVPPLGVYDHAFCL